MLILWWPGWLEEKARAYVLARIDQSTIGARNPDWMADRAVAAVHYWALDSWEYCLPLALTGIAVAGCYFWAKRKISDQLFSTFAILITAAQLGVFVHSWHGFHDPQKFPLFPENEISTFLKDVDPKREFRSSINDFHGYGKEKQIIPANSNALYGYHTFEGFEGLRPAVIYDLPAALNNYRALGALNVRYLITSAEPAISHPDLKLVHRGRTAIYENLLALPRGRIVYDYEPLTFLQMQERIKRGEGPNPDKPWIEEIGEYARSGRASRPGEAEFVRGSSNESVYRLTNPEPGILLVTESFFPGWRAELNGLPVKILRANYAARAVLVPGGGGELVFHFQPESYRIGRVISATSFCFAVIALIFLRRRRLAVRFA